MKRGDLLARIYDLEIDEELKRTLELLVQFIDEEDEIQYSKMKNDEIDNLKNRISSLEHEVRY